MARKKKKKMKKSVLFVLSGLILALIGGVIILMFHKDKKDDGIEQEERKEYELILVDDLEVEVNSKVYVNSFVDENFEYEIVSEDVLVDTSKLGNQEVNITFIVDDEEYEKSFEIKVVDTEAPVITCKDSYVTTVGEKIDFLKDVKVSDNSKEKIDVKVEGNYDFNKAGNYDLEFIAKDSSGNEGKKKFNLFVKEKVKAKEVEKTSDSSKEKNNSGSSSFTTSKGFEGKVIDGVTYIDGILIANKTYSLPSTYGSGLTSQTSSAFSKMQAAAKEDGINIKIGSGFRSYSTQKNLYNNYVKRDGKAAADTYSARPGHSEHQTGLGFDIVSTDLPSSYQINSTFDNTDEAKWASDNAYKYGFILRYPKGKTGETGYKYESWHFRYVGEDLAKKLYNNGNWITLEAYFGITSEYGD